MLRVITQEQNRAESWDVYLLYLQQPQKKGRRKLTFEEFTAKGGVKLLTPPSKAETEIDRQRQVRDVRKRLGSLYRPPVQA